MMPVPCEDVGSSTQCHWTKIWCLLLSRHVIRQALTRQWQGIWLFQPSERREVPTFDQFWRHVRGLIYCILYSVYIYNYIYVGVLSRGGFPKSFIFIGLSIINHPVWGTSISGRDGKFPLLIHIRCQVHGRLATASVSCRYGVVWE